MRQSWDERDKGGERARERVRWGFARAVRQVLDSIVAAGQPPPRAAYVPPPSSAVALPGPTAPDSEAARERARSVLEQARAEMPSLLQDTRPAAVPEPAHVPAEAAGLRQALRSYTDHVDRLLAAADDERRALREQVNRLSEELLVLRAEVTGLRALIPPPQPPLLHQQAEAVPSIAPPVEETPPPVAPPVAPSATAGPVPTRSVPQDPSEEAAQMDARLGTAEPPAVSSTEAPSPPADEITSSPPSPPPSPAAGPAPQAEAAGRVETQAARQEADELARWDARVFPAGTIGLLVGLAPVDDFHRLTMIQERLGNEAGVESVELSSYEMGEARLRLTFRMPARGRWLREAIERAAGARIDPATIRFEQGMVHARFSPNA